MSMFTKTITIISVMVAASATWAQSTSPELASRLDRLRKLDANNDGVIDAKEASAPVARLLLDRAYPNGQPTYPVSVSEVLKAAESNFGKTSAPAAPSASANTSAAASPSNGDAAWSSMAGRQSFDSSGGGGRRGRGFGGGRNRMGDRSDPSSMGGNMRDESMTGGPAANGFAPGNVPASFTAPGATTDPPADSPKPKSDKFQPWKAPPGAPDWFVKMADESGQVTMAKYMNGEWTAQKVAEFDKFDVNKDGIITVDEVLKADKASGGR